MKGTKAKLKASKPESRKLIDRLASSGKHALRALLATTYELDAEFLETDFLPSLLGLGAWDDRSWTSRIELEKHLAKAEATAIFLDKACYRARPRSLRVGTYPVDLGAGRILHAKITLLVDDHAVRLIVGSANLTEPGYRKNREVVASLRVTAEDQAHAPLVRQALVGLQSHLAGAWNDAAELAVSIATAQLDDWGAGTVPDGDCWFAWSGGTEHRLWQQFLGHWPAGERVSRISIASPFWSEETGTGPVARFIGDLQSQDLLAPGARVRLLTEARPIANAAFLPVLPESYRSWDAGGLGVVATAAAVDPTVLPEEVDGMEEFRGTRKLHAKVVVIEGTTTTLVYFGSANFTNRGWGFQNANLEAGIIRRGTGKKEGARLTALLPNVIGDEIPLDGAAGERLALLPDFEPPAAWPSFLRALTLVPAGEGRLKLQIALAPDEVLGAWSLALDGDQSSVFTASSAAGDPHLWLDLPPDALSRLLVEQELVVSWWAHGEGTKFPVNVSLDARSELPIAPGCAHPGEHLLLAYYQGRITWAAMYPEPADGTTRSGESQPAPGPSEVDTSKIQAYQVREFVEALQGIRDDLKAASSSPGSMRVALLGSVSPVALARHVADAVRRGVRSPTAGAFQLVEIVARLDEAARVSVERDGSRWVELVAEARAIVLSLLRDVQLAHAELFPPGGPFHQFQLALERFHRPEVTS